MKKVVRKLDGGNVRRMWRRTRTERREKNGDIFAAGCRMGFGDGGIFL